MKILVFVSCILLVLAWGIYAGAADCPATLTDDLKVHIPRALYGNTSFSVDLSYLGTSGADILFKVDHVGGGEGSCGSAVVSQELLLDVSILEYHSLSLWVKFEYVPSITNAVAFRVKELGVVSEGKEFSVADYIPVDIGDEWLNERVRNGYDRIYSLEKVSGSETVNGETVLKILFNGDANQYTLARSGSDGYYVFGLHDDPGLTLYSPPFHVPATVRQGDQIPSDFTQIFEGSPYLIEKHQISVRAAEDVGVAAGYFSGCLKLTDKSTLSLNGVEYCSQEQTTWYAKGVGKVKSSAKGKCTGGTLTTEVTELKGAIVKGVRIGSYALPGQ